MDYSSVHFISFVLLWTCL